MNVLTPELSARKRILKTVCRTHSQWKARISLAVILLIISISIFIGTAYLLLEHPTTMEGVMIFLATSFIFAFIPFAFALSVKNTAKYKCGLPYSSYANGSLILRGDALEYVFWRVGPREPAAYSSKRAVYKDEDKFIYIIKKTDITSIEVRNDICKIKGNGIIQMPEWAEEDVTVKRKNKEFSFIMAFEQKDADQFIIEWRN